ncbi:phage tail protein [Enterococcus sp. BWM-S5]|uniref:Phage tail protein n=1 Tax=Enterococcus larvae TaxID=2794352 RepID=A0ABS4CFS5_9ENTE|nr:major tail protein [Enterococcus larvae]MBP1044845.1 phage tail protein [Enterococcus larvae]
MAKIGINGLYWFEMDVETDQENAAQAPTYKEPIKLAKAIQLTLTPQLAEGNLYADDSIDETETAVTSYDVSLNINDLLPDKEALLLGRQKDSLGGVKATTEDSAPYGALAFRMPRSKGVGGGYQYRILYKTRFQPFTEDAQTKGESINYQTPTLTGKSISRDYDGLFNYKLDDDGKKTDVTEVTKKWFEEVTEPAAINTIPEG